MSEQSKIDRIIRAKTAVEAYAAVSGGGSFDEVFADLLADLMHYADHLADGDCFEDYEDGPCTFDDLLETARMHYTEEIEEEIA